MNVVYSARHASCADGKDEDIPGALGAKAENGEERTDGSGAGGASTRTERTQAVQTRARTMIASVR